MECGIILHHSHPTPLHHQNQQQHHHHHHHPHPWPSPFSTRFPSLSSRISPLCAQHPPGGDSGTNRVRSQNFSGRAKKQRRRWWSDDGPSEPEEEAPGFWEEFLDSMWFLKVLGSYGWMLPFIILSWLAASGPKAFLMAFSIPLGLSVLTFVFKKLLQWIQNNTGYKPSGSKKPNTVNMENVMMEEDQPEIQQKRMQRTWYQSRSAQSGENGSISSNGAPSFGGWEDLIDERELETRQAKRPSRVTTQTGTQLGQRMRELKRRVEAERELPLLLRLLVAVFPFLSTWTNLL